MGERTISDVINQLDDIIARCQERGSRLGFFPAMYRKTTAEVKKAIEQGRFEDAERMERLDVVFADRYLQAFDQQERGEQPTAAWDYAFLMGQSPQPTVVQHLLLGMNAHINLDLAISSEEVAPGQSLVSLKHDFDVINAILGELVDQVQDDLASVFPLVAALDRIGLGLDEKAARLVLRQARATAWDKAVALARSTTPLEKESHISNFDRQTVRLAHSICPSDWRQAGIAGVLRHHLDDVDTVRRITAALAD